MVKIIRGLDKNGEPCSISIDGLLKRELDPVSIRVTKRNWDYVCIVAGIPGSGKSTFARGIARYLDPKFDLSKIAFTVQEFVKITNNCDEFSAVVLDESFQSLNTRVTMSPAFVRLINHIQIIRQKHLFIILCLPNFFDLAKGVAVFRASHLYVTYASKDGRRGRFLAFGRSEKRRLYIKGGKYMNYNAVHSNFYGSYRKNGLILEEKDYDKRKIDHLKAQEFKQKDPFLKIGERNKNQVGKFKLMGWNNQKIADFLELGIGSIENHVSELRKEGKLPKSRKIPQNLINQPKNSPNPI